MEIWEYIEILRSSKGIFLFGRKNENKKLDALKKLAKIGYPSTICSLIPFLKDYSEVVRNETINTIRILFNRLKRRKEFYNALKNCPIFQTDFDFYQSKYSPDEFSLIMKISSLNRDGYVREKAVKKLGQSQKENTLPFIIFRLADWVPNVRNTAKKELRNFIRSKFQKELIDSLSLFKWLKKVKRIDLSEIYKQVINFLVITNRAITIELFPSVHSKKRRILAIELVKSIQSKDEINIFLEDKQFLIRILALDKFDKLTETQKEKLLNDKSSKIRINTLYKFKTQKNFKTLLRNYLADKSGNIRFMARFYLRDEKVNFKEIYCDNLRKNRQIIGSLLGLLDIEANDCIEYVAPYLEADRIRIVKTAFFVISNLNANKASDFAKTHLFTPQIGLRNQIINYYGKYPNDEVLVIVRNKFQDANQEIKLIILKLYSQIGGYKIFPDLLLGTIDNDQIIRNKAIVYLQKWKSEAVNNFNKEKENQRLIKTYNLVMNAHNEKRYFKHNPIKDFEFYVK